MIITVNNLSKIYSTYKRGSSFKETITSFFHREKVEVRAVDDISFTIEKGSITGILGPNGAGKSTTIKMLTGVLYPSAGTIDVMGYSPAKMRKKYVMHIGAVFGQKSQLIWDIPPVDSFNMNRAIYGISKEDYNKRLDMFCSMFDIGDVMKKPTRVLSLGERMKCEFVMALLHNPEIVFLDEPTIGLDVIAKQKIRDFIRDMNKTGTTFILTTHDLDDIEQLAEKVIIINHGKKVFDDSLENLQNALGAKKVVALTLSKPFTDVNMPGVSVISKENDMEVTLEIDTAVTSIESFIRNASDVFHFTDIAVKPLPMEKIITKIYTDKETSK